MYGVILYGDAAYGSAPLTLFWVPQEPDAETWTTTEPGAQTWTPTEPTSETWTPVS